MNYNLRDIRLIEHDHSVLVKKRGITIEIYREDKNRLDAIIINTTTKELPRLTQFLDQLDNKIVNTYNIPIYIVFSRITNDEIDNIYNDINNNYINLSKYINKSNIINLNIPLRFDFYIKGNRRDIRSPYGNKSGPNFTFFRLLDSFTRYNTILIIETDCYINNKNWIDTSYNYVKNNNFLISGTYHRGLTKIGLDIIDHLNGVAFYKTGSLNFRLFMTKFKNFFLRRVRMNRQLAYDVAVTYFLNELRFRSHRNRNEVEQYYYKFIKSNIISNQLIVNTCINNLFDKGVRLKTLNTIYNNPIIIHTKRDYSS